MSRYSSQKNQSLPEFAEIWLPVPKRQTFSYYLNNLKMEEISSLKLGQLVEVPLGKKNLIGMVASLSNQAPEGVKKFKNISQILAQDYAIDKNLFKLSQWAQEHYLAPHGEVLRTFFPLALLKGKLQKGERARFEMGATLAPSPKVHLSHDQSLIIEQVTENFNHFYPLLLQGITGSGKTEVYLALCERLLQRSQCALVMVPEIALTPMMLGRFAARFPEEIAVYHSSMTDIQRLQTWWAAKEGHKKVFIGTRSASALPIKDLGLIIVDEEHDSSYKQEERFRYHARDLAVMRASLEKIPIVLGSATPSIESRENVEKQKYHFFRLNQRATRAILPDIELIDLKTESPHPDTWMSTPLQQALSETLERGEQALLFLNRRGFSPFVLCRDCGHVPSCPNCEISLTYHKRPLSLVCHYCELKEENFQSCQKCQSEKLQPIGIGTERIEDNLKKLYPKIIVGRLDRDIASSRQRMTTLLSEFETGKIDVLVGTQMLAKGHDFKKLTLVGVLLADMSLNLPDFRAAERSFQLLTQVAGRAGRHDLKGKVFIQTYRPEDTAIQNALRQDAENFFLQERTYRAAAHYPPFSRIILLRLQGRHLHEVSACTQKLAKELKKLYQSLSYVKILGPAKASMEKLQGKYRWQILLKSSKFESMRRVLENSLPFLESFLPSSVRLSLDVEPMGPF